MRNFEKAKRVVIKIGTNTLSKGSGLDLDYIRRIAAQVAWLRDTGRQVVIVTSGAIGMGAGQLGWTKTVTEMKFRQACAAIGQPMLVMAYRRAFEKYAIPVAQVLITAEVLANRKTYLNLRTTVETLLELGAIPIVNENDCISTEEIGSAFGDNDTLSALVASKIDADLLIMLTDIDGLYDKNPNEHTNAQLVPVVYEIDDSILKMAGKSGSVHARGGMESKLKAARIAASAGCRMVLAHGRARSVIKRIIQGREVGTIFLPKRKLSNRKRWILHSPETGIIEIDAGAEKAVRNRKSLLPKGIVSVRGNFEAGDVVLLNTAAKAVSNFSSAELRRLKGCHSTEIRKLLGQNRRDVVAIPEDIVLLD